jgi:hypothetical protein
MRGCLTYLLFPVALVAACAHVDPPVKIETVEVVKEVQKPCPGEKPERPAKIGVLPTDLAALAALLGAKLAEYSDPGKYADRADAIMDRCLTK